MAVYTTGAFIEPYLKRNQTWGWRVTQFEDDTYQNGELCNIQETALKKEDLIDDSEDE